jgi:two-component system, NarL family, sensor histidine kinase DevS
MGSSYTIEQIRALVEAGIALTSELSLEVILQKLVEIARSQVNSRYAALSVLDRDGHIAQFVTRGIGEAERVRIGHIPEGHGLLAVLLREGESLRLDDIRTDPCSCGFPPHHPPMKSLLGVPVLSRGRIIGNLYLTNDFLVRVVKTRRTLLIRLLATQAAAAVETGRLQEQLESLARFEERERIAMDLHDGVIQSVYATALQLEDAGEKLPEAPDQAGPVIDNAIDTLHQVIKDISSYIFELRAQVSEVEDLPGAIRDLAETLRVNTLMSVNVEVGAPPRGLSQAQAVGLFHIAHEALNNVSKHSRATSVSIKLRSQNGRVKLEVQDNGIGFNASGPGATDRHGLRNIKDRARSLRADLLIDSEVRRGTLLRVELPLGAKGSSARV